jgi:hypothetical protein
MIRTGTRRRRWRRCVGLAVVLVAVPLVGTAQEQKTVPPGTPVTISVTPTTAPPPLVTITLGARHGHVTPYRQGCCHTGGGNIDVAQPAGDTVVVTMTGVAVATGSPCGPGVAGLEFDLNQCFEITFEKSDVKGAKVTLEGRVIGLLRGGSRGGAAEGARGCATVADGPVALLTVCVPDHGVADCENLSLNDHEGPVSVPIRAGKYTLHQGWHVQASHTRSVLPCKAASAEFAPEPALDPLWISYWEPFHGANKKDFGFQMILKVAPDEGGTGAPPAKANGALLGPPS